MLMKRSSTCSGEDHYLTIQVARVVKVKGSKIVPHAKERDRTDPVESLALGDAELVKTVAVTGKYHALFHSTKPVPLVGIK